MSNVNLVELRDLRRAARDHLGKAYAEDLIDAEELDRRLEEIENTDDPARVRELYEDVIPPGGEALVPTSQPEVTALATVSDAPAQAGVMAIFGETKRTGAWSPARHNRVQTIFGSTQLDFREARLPEGTTEIQVGLVFGEVQILVPPGLPVQTECTVVFGEVDIGRGITTTAASDGPRLLITGYVVFGEVDVYERLPGESRREAKRRLKAERKRLKEEERKRLKEAKRKALRSGASTRR